MVAVGRKGGRTTVHVTEFDQFRNFQSRHARSATVGLAASQVGTGGKLNCPAHNDPLQDLTQYSGTTKLLVTHKKLAVSGVKWTLVRRINKHVSKCGIARHWGQGVKYPAGTLRRHGVHRHKVITMCPPIKNRPHFE